MESTTTPFSVEWVDYSVRRGSEGIIHRRDNVLFAGRKKREQYELICIHPANDSEKIEWLHLYSLLTFNGKKMIIQ